MAKDQFRQSQSRWGNGHGPLTHGRPNLQAAAASRVGLPHGSGTPPSPPHCCTLSAPTADLPPELLRKIYAERRFLAGGFDWTGFDYRGEPSPHKWPCISSHFGAMDTCGFPKDNYFYYQAWCGSTPVLHLFPHWNWEGNEGREIAVWCHTNLDSVELFRNGARLGSRKVSRNSHVDLECEVRARRARGARFKRREGRVS